jgi:hypothetical protein
VAPLERVIRFALDRDCAGRGKERYPRRCRERPDRDFQRILKFDLPRRSLLRTHRRLLSLANLRPEIFSQEIVFSKMPLHRDIFWVGRQWAVTGYGIQAVNRKRHCDFDIEASRIWDEAVLESLRAQDWFNPEDFGKGLIVARARYPQREEADRSQPAMPPPRPEPGAAPPKVEHKSAPPAAVKFDLRIERWPAQFTSLWRVRVRT